MLRFLPSAGERLMRATKYYQIALERLAEHLKVKIVDYPEKKGWVTMDLRHRLSKKAQADEWLASGFTWTGGKKKILAHLVIAATDKDYGWGLTNDEVADLIKLTSVSGNDRGLKGHEWQSLKAVIS